MTQLRAWRRLILSAAAALPTINAAAQPQPEGYLREIRYWTLEEVTRVAVETSHETEYRAQRLSDPDRLSFDFLGVRPRPGLRGMQTIPVNDRLLKQIRMAETQRGVTRVVLDLAVPADFTASQLTNPDRLIIELRPAKPTAAAQAAPSVSEEPKSPAAATNVKAESPAALNPAAAPSAPAEANPPVSVAPKPATPEPKTPAGSAAAAQRDSRGDRSLIRALGLKIGRVVLDPGHGGQDTGTISPGGVVEKELVLDVSKRLGALISERLDSQVVYTRTEDVFVPLEARTELANQEKADLFISLHANSSRFRGIAGPETYYLNFTTSASALEVAARTPPRKRPSTSSRNWCRGSR